MSDNKDIKGQQDRSRVAGDEDYEVRYLAGKMDVEVAKVIEAIEAVGNERVKIEEYIRTH